jgi:hypothetical protein
MECDMSAESTTSLAVLRHEHVAGIAQTKGARLVWLGEVVGDAAKEESLPSRRADAARCPGWPAAAVSRHDRDYIPMSLDRRLGMPRRMAYSCSGLPKRTLKLKFAE